MGWALRGSLALLAVVLVGRAVALDGLAPAGLAWLVVPLLAVTAWACVGCAAVLAVAALLRRPTEVIAAAILLVLGLVLVVPRAVPAPQPTPTEGGQVTVALLNLKTGLADAEQVVAAVRTHGVDVLVTQELTVTAATRLAEAGLPALLPHEELRPSGRIAGGSVHAAFPIDLLDDGSSGTPDVVVRGPDGPWELRTLHPVPPIGPRLTALWSDALQGLPPPPGDRPGLVVGDLNATLDHTALRDVLDRGWRDAAAEAGAGLRPTWNPIGVDTPGPPLTIDHVLVGPGIAVLDVAVVPIVGTDHHMVVAELSLP